EEFTACSDGHGGLFSKTRRETIGRAGPCLARFAPRRGHRRFCRVAPSAPPKRRRRRAPSATHVSTAALHVIPKEQCAMNAIDRTFRRKSSGDRAIELETRYSAPNYAPLPVVLTRGEG